MVFFNTQKATAKNKWKKFKDSGMGEGRISDLRKQIWTQPESGIHL